MSSTDKRAIAFNNLIGFVIYEVFDGHAASTVLMGRLAVSFTDGTGLPDGTILDGITGGYTLLQPDVMKFNFTQRGPLTDTSNIYEEANIVNLIFADNYSGPFGDYRSQPADASFNTLLFDENEVPTSCNNFVANCIIDQGINDVIDDANSDPGGNFVLCPGNPITTGWVRMAVTGLDGLENAVGFTHILSDEDSSFGYAAWMVVEGDVVVPTPEPTPTATSTPTPDGSTSPTGGGQPNGGGSGGGGSGCAIAGPAQAGTAAANMLIVLLPAVGFALRRKFKKS